ncbi:unnamed protein product [Gordionus sp. m RMFG-2023]
MDDTTGEGSPYSRYSNGYYSSSSDKNYPLDNYKIHKLTPPLSPMGMFSDSGFYDYNHLPKCQNEPLRDKNLATTINPVKVDNINCIDEEFVRLNISRNPFDSISSGLLNPLRDNQQELYAQLRRPADRLKVVKPSPLFKSNYGNYALTSRYAESQSNKSMKDFSNVQITDMDKMEEGAEKTLLSAIIKSENAEYSNCDKNARCKLFGFERASMGENIQKRGLERDNCVTTMAGFIAPPTLTTFSTKAPQIKAHPASTNSYQPFPAMNKSMNSKECFVKKSDKFPAINFPDMDRFSDKDFEVASFLSERPPPPNPCGNLINRGNTFNNITKREEDRLRVFYSGRGTKLLHVGCSRCDFLTFKSDTCNSLVNNVNHNRASTFKSNKAETAHDFPVNENNVETKGNWVYKFSGIPLLILTSSNDGSRKIKTFPKMTKNPVRNVTKYFKDDTLFKNEILADKKIRFLDCHSTTQILPNPHFDSLTKDGPLKLLYTSPISRNFPSKLSLVIAEPETAFQLWKADIIDFHTDCAKKYLRLIPRSGLSRYEISKRIDGCPNKKGAIYNYNNNNNNRGENTFHLISRTADPGNTGNNKTDRIALAFADPFESANLAQTLQNFVKERAIEMDKYSVTRKSIDPASRIINNGDVASFDTKPVASNQSFKRVNSCREKGNKISYSRKNSALDSADITSTTKENVRGRSNKALSLDNIHKIHPQGMVGNIKNLNSKKRNSVFSNSYIDSSFVKRQNSLKLKKVKNDKNNLVGLSKSCISSPCQFQHMTKINLEDFSKYYSLTHLVRLSNNGYC